jgi:hypothetical protein
LVLIEFWEPPAMTAKALSMRFQLPPPMVLAVVYGALPVSVASVISFPNPPAMVERGRLLRRIHRLARHVT